MLLYSSHNSKDSEKAASAFNRVCKRFNSLNYPALRVYAFDAATQRVHKTVKASKFPAVFVAPSNKKTERFKNFEGQLDTFNIMEFVEQTVTVKFELPDLHHLSPEEVEEYLKEKQRAEENLIEGEENSKEEL